MTYTARFASRLRELRRKKGLTQREVADTLGFSEKTVSKWECGAGVPDIDTLFRLAELFSVGLASLFEDGVRYTLGIDGGGTKCALSLGDREGRVLRTLTVGACNPMDIGADASIAVLREGIFSILGDIPPSAVACFAGIAGGGNPTMRARLGEFFASVGFFTFENDSDNRNLVAAALGERDGITLVLGTGICAFTQKDGRHIRTGGWGYLIDGGGSGYDLGRDALRAYFFAQDGTRPAGILAQEVARLYDGDADSLLTHIYAGGKRAVASFAPAVFAAMERGDGEAQAVFDGTMAHAAHVVRTAASHLKSERVPVCLAGGLTSRPEVLSTLSRLLGHDARYDLSVLSVPPVEGALMLACKLLLAKEREIC